jgi:hypothetical protein
VVKRTSFGLSQKPNKRGDPNKRPRQKIDVFQWGSRPNLQEITPKENGYSQQSSNPLPALVNHMPLMSQKEKKG